MIVVTGGAGFIGSNLIAELNSRGETEILLVDDLSDSGITLKKSIDWLQHFYGFYLDEPIRTAVLYHKAVSSFVPDYYIDYLEDSPWIHMPFEKYETTNIKDFKFD